MAKTSSSLPVGGNLLHNTLLGLNDRDFQHLTMLEKANLEFISNKQDSLAVDGTGIKYPTVDALNNAIAAVTVPDATSTIKGKLKLTNDLGGTADAPLINVKTINSLSIKGSGDIIIDKTFVGLGNVDNTSDLNKPISTATQNALNLKENKSEKNQINGYAGLDGSGKIFSNQLPALAITDTYVVASQAAMLNLTLAETGDIAVRTDLNKTFILKGINYSILSDWQELPTPTDSVLSVFGRSGAVIANSGDYTTALVTETTNKNYQTDIQKLYNDATSSIQTQLNNRALVSQLNTNSITNNSLVTGATATDALNTLNIGLVYKKTIAQIRALSGTLPTNNFYTTDIRQEGEWYYDASDVVSADNTGTVLVTSDGKRIKRIYENKTVNIEWFGAIGDGYTDNTSFIQSAINTGKKIFVPEGIYIASNITLLNNSSLSGLGEKSILKFKTGSTGYMLNGDLVGGISLEKISLYGADDIEYQTVSSIGTRAGIYLNTNAPKSKITNCKIYGFSAIGVGYNGTVTSKDNKSIDISNCNFLSNYCAVSTAPSGVNHYTTVSGGAGGEYSNIIGSSFYLNRYAVVASAGNTNITGNVISNNGYGIYTTSVSNVGHGNIVSNLINHSTVNSIEMVDNIIGHLISGNSIYSGNIVFTNCTGIIFSSNQISVTGITISGTGFHNFSDNFYFLDPVISGGLTNCLFSNNFSKTTNNFVANDSFVGKITSGYIPRSNSVGRFVNANIYDDGSNIGVGTINPIGKLTIATGTDPTTSISAQVSGTVSMSNNGTGVSLPVISSKSNSSIGMYLIGATADIHAGSTDFQINVRETDNTDFTTLTSSAFKFSRFSTTLVDILRNGNTTFAGNLSAPLFTGTATLTGVPTAPTPTAGTNTTQIATTAFVQNAVSAGASGSTYTPTFSSLTNISSPVDGLTSSYIKVGNIVTVTIMLSCTVTVANTFSSINVTLPINRANVTGAVQIGSCSIQDTAQTTQGSSGVASSTSVNMVSLSLKPLLSGSARLTAQITYNVLQ